MSDLTDNIYNKGDSLRIKTSGTAIKFNPGGLLYTAIRIASAGIIGGELLSGATGVEAAKTVEFSKPLEKLLYEFVEESCINTYRKIFKKYIYDNEEIRLKNELSGNFKDLVEKNASLQLNLDTEIQREIEITNEFFNEPNRTEFFIFFNRVFINWLKEGFLLSEDEISNVNLVIGEHFNAEVFELKRSGKYEKLKDWASTRQFDDDRRKAKYLSYRRELASKYVEAEIIDQDFEITLKNYYIDPYITVYKNNFDNPKSKSHWRDRYQRDFYWPLGISPNLHEFLDNFFEREVDLNLFSRLQISNPLLIISGQPGQGKTSLCYRILYDVYNNYPTFDFYYLTLDSLRENNKHNKYWQYLEVNFPLLNLTSKNRRSVLILDAMESFLNGNANETEIQLLLEELYKKLKENENLTIILTSRESYLPLDRISYRHCLVVRLREWSNNLKIEFFQKIGNNSYVSSLLESNLEYEKDADDRFFKEEAAALDNLLEIIQTPNSAKLIASLKHEDLDRTTDEINVFNIYRHYLDKVTLRRVSSNRTEPIPYDEKITRLVRSWQRDLAYFIFIKNRNLAITKEDLHLVINAEDYRDIDRIKTFKKLILCCDLIKNVGSSVKYQFRHRTLQDFLLAEAIWYRVKKLSKDKKKKALKKNAHNFLQLFAGVQLSREVIDIILHLAYKDKRKAREQVIQAMLEGLPFLFDFHFLCKTDPINNQFDKEPLKKAFHNFLNYWRILGELSVATNNLKLRKKKKKLTKIVKNNFFLLVTTTNAYLTKLQSFNLSDLDISEILLNGLWIEGVKFKYSIMNEANFFFSSLRRSSFLNAKIRNSSFEKCDISESTFVETSAIGAKIFDCTLVGVSFYGNNNFIDSSFTNSDFTEAKFDSINSSINDFTEKEVDDQINKFQGVNFEGCDFKRAIFSGKIDFRDANFKDTIFQDAEIRSEEIKLEGANVGRLDWFHWLTQCGVIGVGKWSKQYVIEMKNEEYILKLENNEAQEEE